MSSFLHRNRNVFLTGLFALTPLVVTAVVVYYVFAFFDGLLAPVIDPIVGRHLPGLGILVTLGLIYLVGLVTTNLLGQKLVEAGERLLTRVPIVKGIYSGSKQLVEAVSLPATGKSAFTHVVLVEYPRREMYMIGFITRRDAGTLQEPDRVETLTNVFVPNTPNPTSGRMVMVPNRDLIPLGISVEEGLKLIISGGFISPRTIRSVRPVAAPLRPATETGDGGGAGTGA
ncbi:MAG TPA: DUF502 domain-containing protein [Thermodesulfobacteriota bacterium]|nr:DUF502 domain-containing protein [Thermodesulfobacteriota bacterium]